MSLRLVAQVSDLQVDPTYRDTVRAIADQSNDFGYMNASIDYLAWMCDCSPRTIKRHLVYLRSIGAIIKIKPEGFHCPVTYRLDLQVFPTKPVFVPKGDTFHTPELPKGDILTPLKGDKVSPEIITRDTNKAPSHGIELYSTSTVPSEAGAKNAPAYVEIFPDVGAHAEENDPFAGLGESPRGPEPPPKMPRDMRHRMFKIIDEAEASGKTYLRDKASRNAFRAEWLDEVAPLIQQLFGYSAITSNCYTVANSLLTKSRPKKEGKPAPLLEMVFALERLNRSLQAKNYKNNSRVNPFLVPRWLEDELARTPETEANGEFLMGTTL